MNAIFTAVFIISALILAITAPDKFIPALTSGGESALKVAVTLFCVYAIWMGLSAVAEKCGLNESFAKAAKPLTKRVFKTDDDKACEYLAMNLSCNLLGIGGAATPFAVKAIDRLEKEKNDYAQKLLFVINSTSVQLLPTTVIALRAAAGSASASDIFLPSLICTVISTGLAVFLFIICNNIHKKRRK